MTKLFANLLKCKQLSIPCSFKIRAFVLAIFGVASSEQSEGNSPSGIKNAVNSLNI